MLFLWIKWMFFKLLDMLFLAKFKIVKVILY